MTDVLIIGAWAGRRLRVLKLQPKPASTKRASNQPQWPNQLNDRKRTRSILKSLRKREYHQ
jgi:hypothetical protein